jgi:hypothetical protein
MYFTNEDILQPLTKANLNNRSWVKRKITPDHLVNSILNKFPVELSCDISNLNTANLLDKLKNVQTMVNQLHNPSLAKNSDHVYHNTIGVISSDDIRVGGFALTLPIPDNHLIMFSSRKATDSNNIGYSYLHEVVDSFDIYSKLSDIFKINKTEFDFPYIENNLDIIYIKQTPAFPYFNYDHKELGNDQVSCYLALNGDVTLSVKPYLDSDEFSYSEKLASTKLTAYNPEILHALTTTSEDAFILNIRFNTMTFTRLLELTNSK